MILFRQPLIVQNELFHIVILLKRTLFEWRMVGVFAVRSKAILLVAARQRKRTDLAPR